LGQAGAETSPAGLSSASLSAIGERTLPYGDGMVPAASSDGSGGSEEFMPRWRQMAEEAGRYPNILSVFWVVRGKTLMP
jgi:hypothetical protein